MCCLLHRGLKFREKVYICLAIPSLLQVFFLPIFVHHALLYHKQKGLLQSGSFCIKKVKINQNTNLDFLSSKEFSFSYNQRNQFHIVSQDLRIFGGFIFSIH